jgi:hypothetical protein
MHVFAVRGVGSWVWIKNHARSICGIVSAARTLGRSLFMNYDLATIVPHDATSR